MNPLITCYPIPGKDKARILCEAFAGGCGASIAYAPPSLLDGAAVFYGVRPAVAHLWHQAQSEGRDWYYIDNSYFDCCREKYFRITKNAVQFLSDGETDFSRWNMFHVKPKPMRKDGNHVVVCQQSDEYLKVVAGISFDWLDYVKARIDRPLRIRKKGDKKPLSEDLKNAWCLVTHNSAAAVEAVIHGIPAVVTGLSALKDCASRDLSGIESASLPAEAGIIKRLGILADNQWTLDEIKSGVAWRALNG